MKRILIVGVLSAASWAQNTVVVVPQSGGVIPPPDIAGSIARMNQAQNEQRIQAAQAALLKQQAALLKAQTDGLKQQNAQTAAASNAASGSSASASSGNAWRIKEQGSMGVAIECAPGMHAEVLTKLNIAFVSCAPPDFPAAPK